MTEAPKLLPCPFCGTTEGLYPGYRGRGESKPYQIDCCGCGIDFTPREGMDVIAAWNRRSTLHGQQSEAVAAVAVKALEWHARGIPEAWYADNYRIWRNIGNPDLYIVSGWVSGTNPYYSLQTAKLAAQADFETRILSAIIPAAKPAGVVEALNVGPLTLATHRTRAEEALCALEQALEALRHSEPIHRQYPEPRERHEAALKSAAETVKRLRAFPGIDTDGEAGS